MPKRNKNSARRIKKMMLICTLSAVLLAVSTYAWFIGMRTVNVNPFEIEIAVADSLSLSLDGRTWGPTITVSQDELEDVVAPRYASNSNSWGGGGLIPMSSIGELDSNVSRMKLFEKASLTPTKGGYRLLASRVDNFNENQSEKDGYVVFDLFVRNFSGSEYYTENNENNEEAIYLTVDSKVQVAEGGVDNTGIENSVRVAFAQIGRVIGTSPYGTQEEYEKIQEITCESDPGNGVTGICRTAQIWEPNDRDHVAHAIGWYNTSCKARTGAVVTAAGAYSTETGTCGLVIDGKAYPTYAVTTNIGSSDNVDVYDGTAYNTYAPEDGEGQLLPSKLASYDYFTDTEKLLKGTDRPPFMTLAPNSITKVRVYIYIEGQDVDNYDFASVGKKISIKFGFTKERMDESDTGYEGEDVNQGEGPLGSDRTAPVITLLGGEEGTGEITIAKNGELTIPDPAYTVTDNVSATENIDVTISGTVNRTIPGTYYIVYEATDEAGNVGTRTRTVIVTE